MLSCNFTIFSVNYFSGSTICIKWKEYVTVKSKQMKFKSFASTHHFTLLEEITRFSEALVTTRYNPVVICCLRILQMTFFDEHA